MRMADLRHLAFASELPEMALPWQAEEAPNPRLLVLNEALALELALDPASLRGPDGLRLLSGNLVPDGATPVAQAYAGHQFGGFVPRLGDGRALAVVVTIALFEPISDRVGRVMAGTTREIDHARLVQALGGDPLVAQRPEAAVQPALARLMRTFELTGALVADAEGTVQHAVGDVADDDPLAVELPLTDGGVARFERGSLLATCAFFGTGVVVSMLASAVLG